MLEQLAVPFVERDLPGHAIALRRGECGWVELVSEHPEERHRGAGVEGGDPAHLVIRHRGDVRPHGGEGVAERGAPLDPEAFHRVRVVAGPGLRREGENAGVEAPAPPAQDSKSTPDRIRAGCSRTLLRIYNVAT